MLRLSWPHVKLINFGIPNGHRRRPLPSEKIHKTLYAKSLTIQHVQQRPVDQRSTSMVRKEGSVPVGESSLTPPQVSCLISYVGPEMFFFVFAFFCGVCLFFL